MAVNLCLSGKPTKEVGLRTELVTRWKREYNQFQAGSFSGHGNVNMAAEQKEITRLKRDLAQFYYFHLERESNSIFIFTDQVGR